MMFSDFIGQERWQRYFAHAFQQQRLSHAYLFLGPRHTGKRTFAWALARGLTCQASAAVACGRCASCRAWSSPRSHPDVVALRCEAAANVVGVDEVRRFIAALQTAPFVASRRVAIIEDVDVVTAEGLSVLLKTLEEPPAGAVLLVVSDSSAPLLATVRSRLQRCVFAPLSRAALARALQARGVSRAAADELAALARGRPGLALRWQAQPDALAAYRAADVQFLNLCAQSPLKRFAFSETVATADQLSTLALRGLVRQWVALLRDCLVVTCGAPGLAAHPSLAERLTALGQASTPQRWLRAYQAAEALDAALARHANRRLALNTFFLVL
jgi:DNA polymerase-3 subunit delta'